MRTKDEKKILLARILVNIKIDPLYGIIEELDEYNFSDEGALTDEEVKLPENRPILVDNSFNTELANEVANFIESYQKLKLLKGLLDE